jgi:hypothetical protein
VYASYVDLTSATAPTPGRSSANITTATTTTILAAPAASTSRTVKTLVITNRHTASNDVRVVYDANGTQRYLTASITLKAGEQIILDGDVFRVTDSKGQERRADTAVIATSGIAYAFLKVGTATEAAAVGYGLAKDSGFPGAWVPGSPGVNGWWTDAGTATNAENPAGATQVGCPVIADPTVGSLYLQPPEIATTVTGIVELYDLLWYNTGIVATTTGEQTFTMPATSVAARDLNGTANGEGLMAGIYVTTVTTNGAAFANCTMRYTNSDGAGTRTATMASFPQSAVVGTFVPFQLAAGDRGIRTIQGVTLGTSMGTGAISLVLYRKLASIPVPVANTGIVANSAVADMTGIKIYPGTALWWQWRGAATTATTFSGSVRVVER